MAQPAQVELPQRQHEFPRSWLNPTTVLFSVLATAFLGTLGFSWLSFKSISTLGWFAIFFLQLFLSFFAFTPLHEASHGIASKNRRLNDFILLFCLIFFASETRLFRTIHITHHTYTNKDEDDPDHFTSGKTLPERWIKSMILVFYYYYFSWTKLAKKSPRVKNQVIIAALMPILILAVAAMAGKLIWGLFAWVLPALIATGILSFVNTSWPHDTGGDTSRMKNTRLHLAPKWVELLMCNQNLHLVHHLNPTLPWWKYHSQLETNREKWISMGARVVDYR